MLRKLIQLILAISIPAGTMFLGSIKALASNDGCKFQPSFSDNFKGTHLDTTKWNTQYPSGNSGEQQYYAPDSFILENGILKITADKRSMQGYPYTSGILTTQSTFSQQYGYFSIRAKLPKGQGFWPAFWMLPAQPAYPAEIDVFEMLGGDPSTIYMSNHWRSASQGHLKNIISYQGPDFSTDFHTFSLLWIPSVLVWYVDGVEQYRTSDGIPDMPMFLLANLAIGGSWPGNPDTTTPFPSSMEIDYIHAYKYQCNSGLAAATHRMNFYQRRK
ncbi:MAG: hypothetical protein A2032_06920 [Chloroflexi bacterium RBG_19FT_COMBO_49_13]|nr:MAG: hypothetical protein A2032_06920 [Chloroflexi bacterium RBG_19FT_COMBO_49_13]